MSFSYHHYIHARDNNASSIINATWSFKTRYLVCLEHVGMLNKIKKL